MQTMMPPEERRRLSRRYRWVVVVFWVFVAIVALVVLGHLVGDGDAGFRDDLNPAVVILVVAAFGGGFLYAKFHVNREMRLWSRAARVPAPLATMRGTIVSIRHTRVCSIVEIDVGHPQPWTFRTSDRNDAWSLPGDAVTVELYATSGTVPGAYQTDRTGRVRAVTTRRS